MDVFDVGVVRCVFRGGQTRKGEPDFSGVKEEDTDYWNEDEPAAADSLDAAADSVHTKDRAHHAAQGVHTHKTAKLSKPDSLDAAADSVDKKDRADYAAQGVRTHKTAKSSNPFDEEADKEDTLYNSKVSPDAETDVEDASDSYNSKDSPEADTDVEDASDSYNSKDSPDAETDVEDAKPPLTSWDMAKFANNVEAGGGTMGTNIAYMYDSLSNKGQYRKVEGSSPLDKDNYNEDFDEYKSKKGARGQLLKQRFGNSAHQHKIGAQGKKFAQGRV